MSSLFSVSFSFILSKVKLKKGCIFTISCGDIFERIIFINDDHFSGASGVKLPEQAELSLLKESNILENPILKIEGP